MDMDLGLDAIERRNYELMSSLLKRTCLSAESALTGRPNVESVPLGAKLPMIPGSNLVLHTTELGNNLHLPFCYFDRTFSSDAYLQGEYNCLHDPHLKKFFEHRKDILEKLCDGNLLTPEKKVVCSLKEYNLYRQYLKHLSVQYINMKYSEQCKQDVARKNAENILKMKEKYRVANSMISKKVEKVKNVRSIMEKEMGKKRKELICQMQEYTDKRKREKKEERLRKILLVQEREKLREQKMKDKAMKEYQDMMFRQKLQYLKYQQEAERRQTYEERLQFQRKYREMILIDNYEKKKTFHDIYMEKLRRVVADQEARRKRRVSKWESYFARKQKSTLESIESIKAREKKMRERERRRFEERLRQKGWTGSACRPKEFSTFQDRRRTTHGRHSEMLSITRQLSALGFHDVQLPSRILEALCTLEDSNSSSGDLEFGEYNTALIARNKAKHDVSKVRGKDLESFAKNLVARIVDVGKNVLLPMLRSYESKMGVKVAPEAIPGTLRELSSGVFAEDADCLPLVLSVHDTTNEVTAYAGSKKSNVRFRVSNTELPLDIGNTKNRPPTPRRVRFSSAPSDEDCRDMASDSRLLLEETVRKLSEKVVREIFANTKLVTDTEIQKEQMNERVNNVAKSIIDEIVMFGLEEESPENSSSKSPVDDTESSEFSASLEQKLSHLANHLVTDVVPGMERKGPGSTGTSSSCSQVSIESNISVLALRVVRSILATFDPKSGKTIGQHLAMCDDLEEKVTSLSAKVVKDIANSKSRQTPESIECAALEAKISKLALNIISSVNEGKRPESGMSLTSMSCAGVEERVLGLAARIIGGIISLKKTLPENKKLTGDLEARPANSVERLLREIFDIDALVDATGQTSQKTANADVRRMSYDIARRLLTDRDGGSAVASGLNELATKMGGERGNAFHDSRSSSSKSKSKKSSEKSQTPSNETRISSALSEIAELVSNNVMANEASVQSAVSSGASDLAAEAADGAITKALIRQRTADSAAIDSGINALAKSAVKNVMDNVTQTKIASEIKVLAEKIMWQAVEMAVTDPDSLDRSTRSAISQGASTLATQVAHMVSGSSSGSSSAMSTLQSILSSAVSDMVADMLTRRVLEHAKEQDMKVVEDRLSDEVDKLVRNLLGMKASSSKSPSSDERNSKSRSTAKSSDSTASSVALDVVKTYLTRETSRDQISDNSSSSSAISAIATKYVYEVLGMKPISKTRLNPGKNGETREISFVDPDLPKTHRSSDTSSDDMSRQKRISRRASVFPKPETTKRTSSYSTSFADWRNSQTAAVLAKNDSDIDKGNAEEFDDIMDSLAKRIVSSIIANPEIEGDTKVDRSMMDSPSVEELVGNMALGVVTSLLGLDVLSNPTSSECGTDESRTSENSADTKSSSSPTGKDVLAPGPSTGQTGIAELQLVGTADAVDPVAHEPCPSLLSIFSSESMTESSVRSVCEDNAQEHPFRVRSPTGRDAKFGSKLPKARSKLEDPGNMRRNKDALPKSRRTRPTLQKALPNPFRNNPLKQSSGFLDRHWLSSSKELEKNRERLPPIERNRSIPRSTTMAKDKSSKYSIRDVFTWQQ